MLFRWCMGWTLALSLVAGQPGQVRTQAWVLALDERGGMVGDLKPAELQVKVEGKACPLVKVMTPAQTADAAQSWVLVFEPIRDTNMRAIAFTAAADFLTKVPEGDRVFIVARGKDSLESLMPGFSVRRSLWAEALAKVPAMLPESLVGSPKEVLQGLGFQAAFTDGAEGPAGQEALTALTAKYRTSVAGWALGTTDQRGVKVIDRLNFDNRGFVTGTLATIVKETRALISILDQIQTVPGQKHLIVFSRCESDDMSHPSVKQAAARPDNRPGSTSSSGFKREKGDQGGPAEAASLAVREMDLIQAELKNRAVAATVTLYSVAGSGQNVNGHIGNIAQGTGGYAFPLVNGTEFQFGQGIQVFGSRYLVQWAEDKAPASPGTLEISSTRKGVKVIAQATR